MGEKAATVEDSLLMAYANFKLKNYEAMLAHVQEALKKRKEFPLALHYKALALWGLGDLKGAEIAIKTSIVREKDNFHHVFLLGIIQWGSGDMKAAENNLKKAITYSPNESVFLIEYATFLIHRGRFDEALDASYRAKSINEKTPKLTEVFNSAKQREFKEGIDDLVYTPPLPYATESAIPYNKLGSYYLGNDFLSNAIVQFGRALHFDDNNEEARGGLATAIRLKEAGFYHFASNFAHFLLRWYIIATLILLVGFLSYIAWLDREFMLLPAILIVVGLVSMIALFLFLGLARKTSAEYTKILSEWNATSVDELMDKMSEVTSEVHRRRLEMEAIQNKSRSLLSLSNFFALIFWICFVTQIGLVNINIAALDIDNQDLIGTMKFVITGGIILSVGFAIWFRTKSKAIVAEAEARFHGRS